MNFQLQFLMRNYFVHLTVHEIDFTTSARWSYDSDPDTVLILWLGGPPQGQLLQTMTTMPPSSSSQSDEDG